MRKAARQAGDAFEALRAQLSKAPRLPRIAKAQASLATATADAQARIAAAETAMRQADAEWEEAASTAGQAIAEALHVRAALQAAQKQHRYEGTVDDLIAASFHEPPMHLLGGFTEERHVGFRLDQTENWEDWSPPDQPMGITRNGSPGFLFRWGTYDPAAETPLMFSLLPLIGGGRPWVILSDDASAEAARGLLQALTLRLALSLPRASRFTLLDPLGFGQAFPMARFLPAVRESAGDMATDLQRIQADIRRIARDVVAFHGSFEKLPAEQQAAESYEFILAADFPTAKAYDRRVAEMLFDVGRAGPRAGRYLILHVNQAAELPYGLTLKDLGDAWTIDLTGGAPRSPTRRRRRRCNRPCWNGRAAPPRPAAPRRCRRSCRRETAGGLAPLRAASRPRWTGAATASVSPSARSTTAPSWCMRSSPPPPDRASPTCCTRCCSASPRATPRTNCISI